jgi:hypothetical protein
MAQRGRTGPRADEPVRPVRQPNVIVDLIPQSGTKNLATDHVTEKNRRRVQESRTCTSYFHRWPVYVNSLLTMH